MKNTKNDIEKLMYDSIFSDMKSYLETHDIDKRYPFRKRSDHIKRVFTWATRLMDDSSIGKVDKYAVLIAAIFHDVGYSISLSGTEHAENSAIIFNKYANDHHFNYDKAQFISYLIRNHSRKNLMYNTETPLELIILMEADLLDETGALSIVWDCMAEGAKNEQSFSNTYSHIVKYSGEILANNPMVTEKAKKIWREKQRLIREFIEYLAIDLGE